MTTYINGIEKNKKETLTEFFVRTNPKGSIFADIGFVALFLIGVGLLLLQ